MEFSHCAKHMRIKQNNNELLKALNIIVNHKIWCYPETNSSEKSKFFNRNKDKAINISKIAERYLGRKFLGLRVNHGLRVNYSPTNEKLARYVLILD